MIKQDTRHFAKDSLHGFERAVGYMGGFFPDTKRRCAFVYA